jgi:alkylhydroperoxidase family enzyme
MRRFIHWLLSRQEKELGASLDWMRELADTSLPALFKFALIAPLGNHRKHLPKDAWHVARLVATLHEDCGTCVQIVLNMAQKDGIAKEVLGAVLRDQNGALPEHLRDVHRFVWIVASGDDKPELRERLRSRFGDRAFAELALAIATSRLIPTTKRAMGHSQSCSLIKLAA